MEFNNFVGPSEFKLQHLFEIDLQNVIHKKEKHKIKFHLQLKRDRSLNL